MSLTVYRGLIMCVLLLACRVLPLAPPSTCPRPPVVPRTLVRGSSGTPNTCSSSSAEQRRRQTSSTSVLSMAASSVASAGGKGKGRGGQKKQKKQKKMNPDHNSASSSSVASSGFDADFANMMSKPLPDWFKKEQEKRERFLLDQDSERERIKREFRAKYEVTEEQKVEELKSKWELLERNAAKWDADPESANDRATKKKWRKFWKQEEEDTGFYLPGFFEVFPELKFLWPTWSRGRDGNVILCETDEDCQFPQACCPHPIMPGKKFCCTGTGQRILVPQYCPQELVSEDMLERANNAPPSGDERPEDDEDDWRNDRLW